MKERLLTQEERERYSRQMLLADVGEVGQKKLLAAKVLIVGAGGLASPAAMYLAASGVGEIGVVDDDVVDLSNLQRQIAHRSADVGRKKADSMAMALAALNPAVRVNVYRERLSEDNAEAIL
ncbi:MAG: HesA/MoeB/ThiF family protein, partial [Selenomonas sp.]